MSTNVHEQLNCIESKNTFPGILHLINMTATCNQSSFLINKKNKAKMISSLIKAVADLGITCKQSEAVANCLICDIAICFEERSDDPIILVDKDSDIIYYGLLIVHFQSCSCSMQLTLPTQLERPETIYTSMSKNIFLMYMP